MNVKRLLGLDTQADRYTYGVDETMGYVSSRKIPDRRNPAAFDPDIGAIPRIARAIHHVGITHQQIEISAHRQ